MSCVVDGVVINSEITKNAKGGTELMRSRILDVVDKNLLQNVAIHFSRVDKLYDNKINVLYAHDLPLDPMYSEVMRPENVSKIDLFVFVSYYQRDMFRGVYGGQVIPFSKCVVIPNAIGDYFHSISEKPTNETIKIIYHTTPHRGLELVYPIVDSISKTNKVHLDVYSSFKVYGHDNKDQPYVDLFKKISEHDSMTYHGSVSNEEVIQALRRSDIFLYPCIWEETSCLALMEAVQNGCICIHPDFGALPETARKMTYMFPMSEDINVLVNRSYRISKYIVDNFEIAKQDIDNRTRNFYPYSLTDFAVQWNHALKELHDGKNY